MTETERDEWRQFCQGGLHEQTAWMREWALDCAEMENDDDDN